jgi:orotate phosphoribosyltransferase
MSIDMADRSLAKLLVGKSYIHGDFVLASGRRSQFYFDCKLTTCFADAMPLIGEAFVRAFRAAGTSPMSVGGLTSGADPIANAIAYYSLNDGPVINMFSVRKDRKEHGTRKWIEGCGQTPVAIVDDVVTSGGSVIRAIERAREDNLEIVHVAVLVDREEGGMAAIQKAIPGVPVTAILKKSELDALLAEERGDG